MNKSKLLKTILIFTSAISLFSCGRKTHTVTFNSNGGTEVASQVVKNRGYAIEPEQPEKHGYAFNSWYKGATKFDFENTKITEDITLKAKWKAKTYSINYIYSCEGNSNSNPTSYTIEDEVLLSKPSYIVAGHSFLYWEDQDGNQYKNKINKGTTGDLTLRDVWEANSHTVSGTSTEVEGYGTYRFGDTVTLKYTGSTFGYYMKGWRKKVDNYYYSASSDNIWTFSMPDEDLIIEPYLEPIIGLITYDLDGGVNNSDNPTYILITSGKKTLYPASKTGYEFVNWTLNGNVVTEIDPNEFFTKYGKETIVYKANFKKPYTITVTYDKKAVTVTGGGVFSPGEQCTLTCSNIAEGLYFVGWYVGDTLQSTNQTYTFNVYGSLDFHIEFFTFDYTVHALKSGVETKSDYYSTTLTPSYTSTLDYSLIYTYDSQGRVILIDDGVNGDRCFNYTYDDENRITYVRHSTSFTDKTKEHYKYDEYGNEIEYIVYSKAGFPTGDCTKHEYTYDAQNRIISDTCYFNNELETASTYTYEEKENELTTVKEITYPDPSCYDKETYIDKYNEDGTLATHTEIYNHSDGDIISNTKYFDTYTYVNGKVSKINHYDSVSPKYNCNTYYFYDSNMNLIEQYILGQSTTNPTNGRKYDVHYYEYKN